MTTARYTATRVAVADGPELYVRDYPAEHDGGLLPVVCLHGLTRNCRDFEPLANRLAPTRRVITPDLRGRGHSDYDPDWRNYHPYRYLEDVWTLLARLDVARAIVVGTSLGGWLSALMAHERPATVAAVVLNDIGPELDPRGLTRIAATAGMLPAVSTWDEAIEQTRQNYELALPRLPEATWRWYAANTYRETATGTIDLNFDRNIGVAARAGVSGLRGDPWELFDALAALPVLVLRGELSDILNETIVDRMRARLAQMQTATVADRGHVPLLDEPESVDAITRFLATVDAAEARCG